MGAGDLAPQRPAIIEAGGRTVDARSLVAEANRLAHGLRELGLDPATRSPRRSATALEFMVVYLAAIEAGLYLTPVNFHLTPTRSPTCSTTATAGW